MNSIFYLFIFTISFVNANWYTNNGSIYNNDKIYNIIGCNWNGIETECKVPHGLWLNPLEYYITFLKENGFNSVRIPLSYEIMTNLSTPINNNCVLLNLQYINQTIEFVLEDLFIQLNNNNITILVDLHTIDNIVTECPWTESISYVNTIDAWIILIIRFFVS
jgi:endoglucanase